MVQGLRLTAADADSGTRFVSPFYQCNVDADNNSAKSIQCLSVGPAGIYTRREIFRGRNCNAGRRWVVLKLFLPEFHFFIFCVETGRSALARKLFLLAWSPREIFHTWHVFFRIVFAVLIDQQDLF